MTEYTNSIDVVRSTAPPPAFLQLTQAVRSGDADSSLKIASELAAQGMRAPEIAIARGWSLRQLKRFDEAAAAYREALQQWPDNTDLLNNAANVMGDLNRWDEAAALFARAAEKQPESAQLRANWGRALRMAKRHRDSATQFAEAFRLEPQQAEWARQCGYSLSRGKEYRAALSWFERAVAARPQEAQGHNDIGVTLHRLGDNDAALASFRRAMAISPDMPEAYSNAGVILRQLGDYKNSIAHFRSAVAKKPDYAAGHYNLGLALLASGQFGEGWKEYEWRWELEPDPTNFSSRRPPADAKVWRGEPLTGKSILIHAEQGLGDTVQFCRYAPLIAAKAARTTLLVPKKLVALLQPYAKHMEVRGTLGNLGGYDYQTPLLSIPQYIHGGGDGFSKPPLGTPYIEADAGRIAAWRQHIGGHGFKIGVSWQGNPTAIIDNGRSVPLKHFLALALPGVRLISLQKHFGLEQLQGVSTIERYDDVLDTGPDAFLDTAALMQCLDLVVTCDTSVAHVAGALGVPTWVALKKVPDWRWMTGRSDSPWYPSLRLFRQKHSDDWTGVAMDMRAALQSQAGR